MKSAASLVAAEQTATCGGSGAGERKQRGGLAHVQGRRAAVGWLRAGGRARARARLEAGGLGLVHEAEHARARVDGAAGDELHVVVGLPVLEGVDDEVLLGLVGVGGVPGDVARLGPTLLAVVPETEALSVL